MTSDLSTPSRSVAGSGSGDGGKRERTKLENRRAILEAARIVFAEMGFGAATVRDIIRRTGLASGTFYNYFKSKEEVWEAMLDDSALQVRPRLKDVRERAVSFEEFIRNTFHTFFAFCVEDQATFRVQRRNSGHMRVRMDTPEIIAGYDELQADIELAIAQGLAPPIDADYLTAAAVGVAFEVADRMMMRTPPDVEGATEFATRLFLGGVNALPSRPSSDD